LPDEFHGGPIVIGSLVELENGRRIPWARNKGRKDNASRNGKMDWQLEWVLGSTRHPGVDTAGILSGSFAIGGGAVTPIFGFWERDFAKGSTRNRRRKKSGRSGSSFGGGLVFRWRYAQR